MYEVGQILYTVIEEKQIVIPVKVIEQVTIKTLEGEKTNYKLLLPNNKNQKVDSTRFKNLYSDINEVESLLLENAKSAIDKMLMDSITLEEDFFKTNEELQKCKIENSDIKINLGDGTIANLSKESFDKLTDQEELQKKTWIIY